MTSNIYMERAAVSYETAALSLLHHLQSEVQCMRLGLVYGVLLEHAGATAALCPLPATKAQWMKQYVAFLNFLREGKDGWLDISLPQIDTTLHVKYSDSTKFTPLTYLWQEGVQAARFKVKFREPQPIV